MKLNNNQTYCFNAFNTASMPAVETAEKNSSDVQDCSTSFEQVADARANAAKAFLSQNKIKFGNSLITPGIRDVLMNEEDSDVKLNNIEKVLTEMAKIKGLPGAIKNLSILIIPLAKRNPDEVAAYLSNFVGDVRAEDKKNLKSICNVLCNKDADLNSATEFIKLLEENNLMDQFTIQAINSVVERKDFNPEATLQLLNKLGERYEVSSVIPMVDKDHWPAQKTLDLYAKLKELGDFKFFSTDQISEITTNPDVEVEDVIDLLKTMNKLSLASDAGVLTMIQKGAAEKNAIDFIQKVINLKKDEHGSFDYHQKYTLLTALRYRGIESDKAIEFLKRILKAGYTDSWSPMGMNCAIGHHSIIKSHLDGPNFLGEVADFIDIMRTSGIVEEEENTNEWITKKLQFVEFDYFGATKFIKELQALSVVDQYKIQKDKDALFLFRDQETDIAEVIEFLRFKHAGKQSETFNPHALSKLNGNFDIQNEIEYAKLSDSKMAQFDSAVEHALEHRDLLREYGKDLTTEQINKFFYGQIDMVNNAIELLGDGTFKSAYGTKFNGLQKIIHNAYTLRYKLSKDDYEKLLQTFNYESSDTYRAKKAGIDELAAKIEIYKAENRAIAASTDDIAAKKPLMDEVNRKMGPLVKEKNALEKENKPAVQLDPKAKLQRLKVLAAIAIKSPDEIPGFVELVAKNDTEWKNSVNQKVFSSLDMKYDEALSAKLNLSENDYIGEILSSDSDFKTSFKEMLTLLQANPDKSVKDAFDNLPQNLETKRIFSEIGVNYDEWRTVKPDSGLKLKVEISAEEIRANALTAVEKEFNSDEFKKIPKKEAEKIIKALERENIYLIKNTEALLQNDLNHGDTVVNLRLRSKNDEGKFEALTFKELQKAGKIIEAKMAGKDKDAEFWHTLGKNQELSEEVRNSCNTFYDHMIKRRISAIDDAAKTKSDKVLELTVRKTDMDNIQHSLFLGNHGACCTSVGNGTNQWSAPNYIMNKAIQAIELVDGKTFAGNTMCFIAEVNGVPSLVLDNIELSASYQFKDSIGDAMLDYAKQMTAEIGQPNMPIYIGPHRHKINTEKLKPLKAEMKILGSTGKKEVYIDTFTQGRIINSQKIDNLSLFEVRGVSNQVRAPKKEAKNISISIANENDLRAIHRLDVEEFSYMDNVPTKFEDYKNEHANDTSYVIKGDAGEFVGYLQTEPINDGVLYISNLGIESQYRNSKTAVVALAKIRKMIKNIAQDNAVNTVALHVDAANKDLVRYYEACGFKIKSTIEDYFSNGNNAHYMEVEAVKAQDNFNEEAFTDVIDPHKRSKVRNNAPDITSRIDVVTNNSTQYSNRR